MTYKDIISKSKITAFILGGDAGTAVQTIDSYDALMNFIKSGGNYSKESPGAPIAYKLSYLKDNSPARMSLTTDYEVKQCTRVPQKIRVVLNQVAFDDAGGDAGDDLEIYGTISAQGSDGLAVTSRNCSRRSSARGASGTWWETGSAAWAGATRPGWGSGRYCGSRSSTGCTPVPRCWGSRACSSVRAGPTAPPPTTGASPSNGTRPIDGLQGLVRDARAAAARLNAQPRR